MAATQVQTEQGIVEGIERDGVRVWLGIPYAAPPVGRRRFRPPEPVEPWSGVRDATHFGPTAVQSSAPRLDQQINIPEPRMAEDCLYLNVWAPADAPVAQPVLVWIHGGGLVEGAGSDDPYDGATFARNGDHVVVTLNYRLGAFGFLYLGGLAPEYRDCANLGLLDQIAALRWVRSNISAFGGDPDNVTVFGESAGGVSILSLMAMPPADGLFRRAIVESAGAYVHERDEAASVATGLLAELGTDGDPARLQSAAAETVQAATERYVARVAAPLALLFRPVIDGETLPRHPFDAIRDGSAAGVALITGSNRDEGNLWFPPGGRSAPAEGSERAALFTPAAIRSDHITAAHLRRILVGALGAERGEQVMDRYDVSPAGMARAISDAFRAHAVRLATAQAPHAPVWLYRFDWSSPMQELFPGAVHALEVAFVWNTLDTPFGRAFSGGAPDAKPLAELMHRSWIAFARHGDPNVDGLPGWPMVSPETPVSMVFDGQPRVARVD